MNMNTLMTGDLVITVNGKMATVMKNTTIGNILRFHTEKDSFSYIDQRYNDDFTHKSCSGLTIAKVYRVDADKIEPSKIGDLIANPEKMMAFGTVIYDADAENRRATAIPDIGQSAATSDKPTIATLLTGDMLVHGNGKVSTVYKDTPFGDITRYHTEKNSFSYLYKFDNETLEHESKNQFDIIGVFRAQRDDNSTVGDIIANPSKMLTKENEVWVASDWFVGEYWYKGEKHEFDYSLIIENLSDCDSDYDDDDSED